MGSLSIWHWLIVLAVVLLLFGGGGKISKLMGDFGKGLKSFKKGLNEDEAGKDGQPAPPAGQINASTPSQPQGQATAANGAQTTPRA
ncbi:MAG: twin-arginine translocase TatA/TatE family subunit [Alphaproteobacteria bacterium]|nr:twin-arginine translocase TatA/TatE family subunit [Alphaproteobacteria bacterium]